MLPAVHGHAQTWMINVPFVAAAAEILRIYYKQ